MKETRALMGMPITIEIEDAARGEQIFEKAFGYLSEIDRTFSTYKPDSEISRINRGELNEDDYSARMREIFELAEQTSRETNGYFNMRRSDGSIDPSGVVKGWAIHGAANLIAEAGFENFYVEAGGDIEARGLRGGEPWRVGIRNPFNAAENVKILRLSDAGVATSGNYERGLHMYNPHSGEPADEVASVTIVGRDACEADRFATAAFVMGEDGIAFIERQPDLEGYLIRTTGIAVMTSGFQTYVGI